VDRETVAAALAQLRLSPTARAEELDLGDWLALSNLLLEQMPRMAAVSGKGKPR
jgi:16S rRNA A1518/A1519 N6-dimethyltransferase RsmA/KsgA/DIM1 with predicted DNA glycosylase/AP lyase activity